MAQMIEHIQKRDFEAFGELTMKDSSQFHATCLDTFPPIFYLNDTSKQIIALVHRFNAHHGKTKVRAGEGSGGGGGGLCCFQSLTPGILPAGGLHL